MWFSIKIVDHRREDSAPLKKMCLLELMNHMEKNYFLSALNK